MIFFIQSTEIIQSIKEMYESNLTAMSWMDDDTQNYARRKVSYSQLQLSLVKRNVDHLQDRAKILSCNSIVQSIAIEKFVTGLTISKYHTMIVPVRYFSAVKILCSIHSMYKRSSGFFPPFHRPHLYQITLVTLNL